MTGVAGAADIIPAAKPVSVPIPAVANEGGFYLSLHGGAYFSDDPESSFRFGGEDLTGVANSENGYQFGGAIGYDFSPFLGVEAEISYSRADIDSMVLGPPTSLTMPAGGHASLLSLMGNAVVGTDMGRFRPYVGAGAGAAQLSLNIIDFGSGVDDTDWAWAAQVFAGVEFELNDRASIGTRYRYRWVGSTDFSDGNDLPIGVDQFGGHGIEAVLKISFGN